MLSIGTRLRETVDPGRANPYHAGMKPRTASNSRVQFRLRLYAGETIAVGPGKVALLEAIAETGSISAAARHLGMSYRRAWLLMDELGRTLTSPALQTAAGGAHGGGASLTPLGEELVRRYRAIEKTAQLAAARDIAALARLIAAEPAA